MAPRDDGIDASPLGPPVSSERLLGSGPPVSSERLLGSGPPGSSERLLGSGLSGPKGWYQRFLPHCDDPGILQFITYRLADSIPAALLAEVEDELRTVSPARMELERRRKIETLLDMGHGSGVLRHRFAADCVIENWYHLDGHRYDLIAWVVMPTHVHVLIRPLEGESLVRIVQSWKSYTGKRLKARYPQACVDGQFWKREYWDRYIRDETHFQRVVEYIQQNPVKAGLVKESGEWPYVGVPRGWGDHP